MLTILTWFIFAGSAVCTIGSIWKSMTVIIIGRTVYGLGGDSITSSQWAMVMEYFDKNQIGAALVRKNRINNFLMLRFIRVSLSLSHPQHFV
jgi:hypothetical protein